MKINLTLILGVLVLILGSIVFIQHKKLSRPNPKERIYVPYHIPAQRGAILSPKNAISNKEYVFLPITKTVTEVDTALLEKYRAENDSLKKELMYKDAIAIREYEELYTDTLLDINVKAKVRGTLLDLYIPSYTIHPINGETPYDPPIPWDIFIGGELGIPTTYDSNFLLKVNADLRINKMMYGLSYDTDRRIWGRLSYKIL